ncbi:MAG TPA: hypothetical protein VF748_14765 [Candidatus Acidoferrum sp.]
MRKLLKLSGYFFGALLGAALAFGGGMPLVPSSPQFNEPSQIVATLNALISQLNGQPLGSGGYAVQPGGIVSLGSFCTASGATPQTCNATRGVVTTNSLATAASTAAAFVINDNLVTANSACGATVGNTASTGTPAISSVVTGAGTITVLLANVATATAFNNTVNINFSCTQ